jgi:DNA-binding CsgD family transcriptional regulator
MNIWQFFKRWQAGSRKKKRKYYYIPGNRFQLGLTNAAAQEKHKQKKRTSDSQPDNLPNDFYSDEHYHLWIRLSPREQDVTALTCLKYTNAQIAARLGLSIETVRTYLDNALNKLSLQTKADLRVFFAGWDFSEWERRKDPYR